MKKKYIVEFLEEGKESYEFVFITSDVEKAITDFSRNRKIVEYKIVDVKQNDQKELLLG